MLTFDSRELATTVAVYDADGHLEWNYVLPSMLGQAFPLDVRTASDGTIYLLGQFWGTVDFDAGPGTTELTGPPEQIPVAETSPFASPAFAKSIDYPNQSFSVFLLSLTPDGQFRWGRQWEALHYEIPALAISPAGEPHLFAAAYGGVDIDPGPAEKRVPEIGAVALPMRRILIRLDAAGNLSGHREWLPFERGWTEFRNRLDFDTAGNIYVAGVAQAPADLAPQPGTFPLAPLAGTDPATPPEQNQFLYVEKLDPQGDLLWVDTWPMPMALELSVAVAPSGHTVIGGASGTLDFDPGSGEHFVTTSEGSTETSFVMSLDPTGALEWVQTQDDTMGLIRAIARAADGSVYVAGAFRATEDFDPGPETTTLTVIGAPSDSQAASHFGSLSPHDAYLMRLSPSGEFAWATSWGGEGHDDATALHLDDAGRVVILGHSQGEIDLDPSPQKAILSALPDEELAWVLSIAPEATFE